MTRVLVFLCHFGGALALAPAPSTLAVRTSRWRATAPLLCDLAPGSDPVPDEWRAPSKEEAPTYAADGVGQLGLGLAAGAIATFAINKLLGPSEVERAAREASAWRLSSLVEGAALLVAGFVLLPGKDADGAAPKDAPDAPAVAAAPTSASASGGASFALVARAEKAALLKAEGLRVVNERAARLAATRTLAASAQREQAAVAPAAPAPAPVASTPPAAAPPARVSRRLTQRTSGVATALVVGLVRLYARAMTAAVAAARGAMGLSASAGALGATYTRALRQAFSAVDPLRSLRGKPAKPSRWRASSAQWRREERRAPVRAR